MDGYKRAGLVTNDFKEITDRVHDEFLIGNAGKIMIAGSDGFPTCGDIPPATAAQLFSIAESKNEQLRYIADSTIGPLQDAVDLNIATDDETAQLKAWKTYRVMLNRVDVSKAPDIDLPVAPKIG